MPKINEIDDLERLIDQINHFSHVYILNTNNDDLILNYAKLFAQKIILENCNDESEKEDIIYNIKNNIFDDVYIVNPDTININNIEIEKLLKYMETKSIRESGRRVYIINGIERISTIISNKLLKFLEEPEDNIYAIFGTKCSFRRAVWKPGARFSAAT